MNLQETLRSLQAWPWLDSVETLRARFREDRLGLAASSLTFTTIIALVPLVTVMLAVFSAFPMFKGFQQSLQKYLLQSLVPDDIARPVMDALTQFASQASRLGSVGLAILVITAIALMLTIDRSLNAIWRVPKPRPIAQRVLVYWAALTLGPLLLGISLSLTSYAVSASRGFVSAMPGGVAFLLNTLEFALFTFAMAGLFHYVPNTHVRWRHALAGGIFVSVGFEAAKRALGWYVAQVPTYSMVYGAFAAVPIFLIWIYCGWVVVLLGAVVAAYTPSLSMRVMRQPNAPGQGFALALAVLRALLASRTGGAGGVSLGSLAETMRVDPLQIQPVLEVLASIGWVGRLEEEGDQRHVLLCDPALVAAAPLVERLLLSPGTEVQGFWRHAAVARMSLADLLAEA